MDLWLGGDRRRAVASLYLGGRQNQAEVDVLRRDRDSPHRTRRARLRINWVPFHGRGSSTGADGHRAKDDAGDLQLFPTPMRSARSSGSGYDRSASSGSLGPRPTSAASRNSINDLAVRPLHERREKFSEQAALEELGQGHRGERRAKIIPHDNDKSSCRRGRHAHGGDARSGNGDAHPPQPEARDADRHRPRDAGRR